MALDLLTYPEVAQPFSGRHAAAYRLVQNSVPCDDVREYAKITDPINVERVLWIANDMARQYREEMGYMREAIVDPDWSKYRRNFELRLEELPILIGEVSDD